MANTRVQTQVEDWVRRNWLSPKYGQRFRRDRVTLTSGGEFDFDAISDDDKTVASISTSAIKTAGGKLAVGKIMKIRSDLYFLLLVNAEKKIIVFVEQDTLDWFRQEQNAGRVPKNIEFELAEIPADLRQRLEEARAKASKEVTPLTYAETSATEL